MIGFSTLRDRLQDLNLELQSLANTSLDVPVIGNWGYAGLGRLANYCMQARLHTYDIESAADAAAALAAQVLSWDQIKSQILGAWTWLPDPVGSWWDSIRARVLGSWTWLNDPIGSWWSAIRDRVLGAWTWLPDPVGSWWDSIKTRVLGAWTWLPDPVGSWWDSIYAKITGAMPWLTDPRVYMRTIVVDWMLDSFIDFMELMAPKVVNAGYRILRYVWNLPWNDGKHEVPE